MKSEHYTQIVRKPTIGIYVVLVFPQGLHLIFPVELINYLQVFYFTYKLLPVRAPVIEPRTLLRKFLGRR